MYQVLFRVKSNARTLNGINRAIERETGERNYFLSDEELQRNIRDCFLCFYRDYFEILGDIG